MEKEQVYQKLIQKIPPELIKQEEPMKQHTSFKIGGNADFLITATTEEVLKNVLIIASDNNIPLTVIGNGTNLLVKDKGVRGIVLKIAMDEIHIEKNKNMAIVTLGAGLKNAVLAQMLLKQEIAGFEFAAGIPGTIGGAVYMNAGAYGGEMKDIVQKVTYLQQEKTPDKTTVNLITKTFTNKQCDFDYRHSIFQQNDFVITKVILELPYGSKEEIKAKIEENSISRKTKQPLEYPSAGSTFKRGNDFITAKLIDECGLKGYHIGDAEVSTMHAGFVINKGNATAQEVIEVIEHIKTTVLEQCGKQIELEIKVIGE